MRNDAYLNINDEQVKNEILSWWNTSKKVQIKRCKTIDEILLEPELYKLKNSLEKYGKVSTKRLSFAIGVVSHVRTHSPQNKFWQRIKEINEDRFKKFIITRDDKNTYLEFVRIIHILQDVDIISLFKSAYYWNDIEKKRLIDAYYTTSKKEE